MTVDKTTALEAAGVAVCLAIAFVLAGVQTEAEAKWAMRISAILLTVALTGLILTWLTTKARQGLTLRPSLGKVRKRWAKYRRKEAAVYDAHVLLRWGADDKTIEKRPIGNPWLLIEQLRRNGWTERPGYKPSWTDGQPLFYAHKSG